MTNLYLADSPREAWASVVWPWFEATLPRAWKQALPSLVVVPTRSHAHTLKTRLLEERQSHLGLRFVTPAALREMLSPNPLPSLRANLRLLLALAADATLRASSSSSDRNELAAKAVLRAPGHLLSTLERLEAAGWDFETIDLPAFRPIVRRFRQYLENCGLKLRAQHNRMSALSPAAGPLFSNILVTGFDGAHWPDWFLLRAAVAAAEQATVVLENPLGRFIEPDTCWIGSWEEAFGEARPAVGPSPRVAGGESLFSEAEMRGLRAPPVARHFLVGADATEQAKAIALLCLRFLADEEGMRVAVVCAAAGSLSRLITGELSRLGIAHHNSFAHPAPGLFEAAEWRAWLQLQRGPRINSLLRFLNALAGRDKLFPEIHRRAFERALRSAHAEILIDDVELLCSLCPAEVAKALRSILFLPARGTLPEFLEATKRALTHLGWKRHWSEVALRGGAWTESISSELPRILYLRWLEEIASSFGAARDETGDHPYARVQLLSVAQACGQEWSHLIFAGLNEGVWPPAEKGEFPRAEEIADFNRGAQHLNRRATRQGSQGEGHTSVRGEHSLYLGPSEQRQIALHQSESLLESATRGVGLGASLAQESAPDRVWNPSELFTRLYQEVHRRPLTHAAMQSLHRATIAAGLPLRDAAEATHGIEQTRIAYEARRDPTAASGEYDFALRAPFAGVPTLSVSKLESMLRSPALVWMECYLGVEAPDDETNPWSAATGQWVHRWLASIGGTAFTPLPSASEIDERIRSAAERKCAEVSRLCHAAGKTVPDWWRSGWQNALCLARLLGGKLGGVSGWDWMAAEWSIDGGQAVAVSEKAALTFRGRIDLTLARGERAPDSLAAPELWILDYKTGAKKPVAPGRKKLLDGTALQLALYALAARQYGARDIRLSLLSPAVRPVAPQLSVDDVAAEADIFEELARMQQTGIFGRRDIARGPWNYARAYPLATLAVERDVLDQRWELTHPALAQDEEEIYW